MNLGGPHKVLLSFKKHRFFTCGEESQRRKKILEKILNSYICVVPFTPPEDILVEFTAKWLGAKSLRKTRKR